VLSALVRLFLDAVAPRRCAGCEAVSNSPLCHECTDTLVAMPVPAPRLLREGRAFAGFEFIEPVRSALHRGKYSGDRSALAELAALTSRRLELSGRSRPDAVVAVPLGPRRRRQRGFNQSEVLAQSIAATAGIHVLSGLNRVRDTVPQTARDESTRRTNVADAFAWGGRDLAAAHLWLVDDVLTTGATVEAAAAALSDAGAARIDVVVVAVVL
jgi:ComF family protein